MALVYLVASSGAAEDVGRIGASLTSEQTSDPDDACTTAERETMSVSYLSTSSRVGG